SSGGCGQRAGPREPRSPRCAPRDGSVAAGTADEDRGGHRRAAAGGGAASPVMRGLLILLGVAVAGLLLMTSIGTFVRHMVYPAPPVPVPSPPPAGLAA